MVKKKYILLIILLFFIKINSHAQTYTLNANLGTITTCSGTFVDQGGAAGAYQNNSTFTVTFCSGGTQGMQLTFSSLDIENSWDFLSFYNGPNTASPLIQTVTGNVGAITIQSTTPCMTVRFTSDVIIANQGWNAIVSCLCDPPIAVGSISNLVSPYKGCLNQNVDFDGLLSTAVLGFNVVDYQWDYGDGTTGTGSLSSHAYSQSGNYTATLIVEDDNNCTSINPVTFDIQVGSIPTFVGTTPDQTQCVGYEVCLTGVINPSAWSLTPNPLNTTDIAIVDDQTFCSVSTIDFSEFIPGSSITSASQIQNIFGDLEHTYSGDLSISIICPTGQQSGLFNSDGTGGTPNLNGEDFGNPTANDGYLYTWTSTGQTMNTWGGINTTATTIAAGTYGSEQAFTNLIGCDLNGTWTFEVCDLQGADDGTIFEWGITFDPSVNSLIQINTPTFNPDCIGTFWSGADAASSAIISSTSANCDDICVMLNSVGTFTYNFTGIDENACEFDINQCAIPTTMDITVIDEIIPVITCGTSTTNSVEFSWTALNGASDYDITYTINGLNPTIDNGFVGVLYPVTGLNAGDDVELTITVNGTNCYTSASLICSALDCIPPVINTQASDVNQCEGLASSFSISETGGSSYQWQESTDGGLTFANLTDGGIYSGTNSTNLSISDNTGLDGNFYQLIVNEINNSCPTTSTSALLSVTSILSPVINCGTATTNSVEFIWAALIGATDYDISYSINGGALVNDNGFLGTTYPINGLNPNDVVEITISVNGTSCYNSSTNSCTAISCTSPTINTQPINSSSCEGLPVTFSITETGGTSYQWQISSDGGVSFSDINDGGVYSGSNSTTLNISDNTGLDGNIYQIIVNEANGLCPSISTSALLTVTSISSLTISCGTATTNSVEFNWIDLIGVSNYDISYTINGGATITTMLLILQFL